MSKQKHIFKFGDKVIVGKFPGTEASNGISETTWQKYAGKTFTISKIDSDGESALLHEDKTQFAWLTTAFKPVTKHPLSGAARTAHEKKNLKAGQDPIPPYFPDAPRPEAKVGEKFVLVDELCKVVTLSNNDGSSNPFFETEYLSWARLRPLTASEATAEAEKDAKKAEAAPKAVKMAEVAPAKESFKLIELMTTAGGEIAVVIEIDGEKIGAKANRGLLLKIFPQLKDII